MMKSYSANVSILLLVQSLLLSFGGLAVEGFAPSSSVSRTSSTVYMGGFLNGRVPKNDIMKKEDDAMWVDDGSSDDKKGGGWNPFDIAKSFDGNKKTPTPKSKASAPAKKKGAAAAATPPKKTTGGFKMPWDK